MTNHYSNTKGPQLGQKAHFFDKWWGNPKGLLGQMPHYATVLKNALVTAFACLPNRPIQDPCACIVL